MERTGVKVERATLASLSLSFAQTIARLEDEIRELAGEDFNIGSPKQLGEILFDKMSLAGRPADQDRGVEHRRRGAGGAGGRGSRAAAQGARLAAARQAQEHLYRRAADLHPSRDGPRAHLLRPRRDHHRAGCRRSSRICRTSRCARRRAASIRKAFVAEKGKKLISADYSQIELRVLAHMADTPTLRQAFADGLDIHAMTASEMFGVPIEGMDPGIRRKAKAINFGIIYGISSVGLAAQLGISQERGRRLYQDLFRALPRHPRLHGGDEGGGAPHRLCEDPVRAEGALPRDQHQEPVACAAITSAPPSTRRSRARPPTSSAAP